MLDAAKAMKLSAKDLLDLKIIDEIISEPIGGAHRDKNEILMERKNKFLKIGRGKGFIKNPEEISDLKSTTNKFISYLKFFKINKINVFIISALVLGMLYYLL